MKNNRGGVSTGSKFGIGCGVLLLALALFVMVRWATGTSVPNLVVPPKTGAPTPNAFDTFRSAAQLQMNTKQIGDAFVPKPTITLTLFQKDAIIASNAQALQTFRTGLSQDYYDMSPRSINTSYPHFAQFRSMARLLAFEGTVRAEHGDWNGAVRSDLDCIRMGEQIPHGGPLIGDLVGIACQAIGRRKMWSYIDQLGAGQSRAAVAQMEAVRKLHVPYADTIGEERYMSMSALNIIFKSKDGMRGFVGVQNAGPPAAVYQLMYLVYPKDMIASNNQKFFDALITNARKPYAMHLPEPSVPTDPINQVLAPVFSQAAIKDVENETQNGLLCVTLALHAYRLEHGVYPKRLVDLTPAVLSSLPDDPFALKGTFQYHLQNGGKYVLYSIGPDSVDDGGKMIDNPAKATNSNSNARYNVYDDSKGDIVAGKNIW